MKLMHRVSKPTHSVGVTVAVPHSRFTPTPTMTPAEIAQAKGAEAKRLGRPDSDNPYPAEQDGLSAEWAKGYGS